MKIIQGDGGRIAAQESAASFWFVNTVALLLVLLGAYLAYYGLTAPPLESTCSGMLCGFLHASFSDAQLQVFGGVILLLLGFVVVYHNRRTLILLDKSSGKLSITGAGLFSSDVKRFPLADVKAVEIRERMEADRTSRDANTTTPGATVTTTHTYYDLNFDFGGFDRVKAFSTQDEAGFALKLNPFRKPASLVDLEDVSKQFAAFLGVPFEERRAPTVSEALAAVTQGIQGTMKC